VCNLKGDGLTFGLVRGGVAGLVVGFIAVWMVGSRE
jgi:hypothetical protein